MVRNVKFALKSTGEVILPSCFVAEDFVTRFRGLIGRKSLDQGSGMYFPKCTSIHMWFMSMPIDVVFLKPTADNELIVTSTRENIQPWKLTPVADLSARDVLELPAGDVSRLGIQEGATLCIS